MPDSVLAMLVAANRLESAEHLDLEQRSHRDGAHPLLLACDEDRVSWSLLAATLGMAGFRCMEFDAAMVRGEAFSLIPWAVLEEVLAVPLEICEGRLIVAVADPLDPTLLTRLGPSAGMPLEIRVADPTLLSDYLRSRRPSPAQSETPVEPEQSEESVEPAQSETPVEPAQSEESIEPERSEQPSALAEVATPAMTEVRSRATAGRAPRAAMAMPAAEPVDLEETVAEPVAALQRRSTVHYFRKMYQHANYPLRAVVSKGRVVLEGPQGSSTVEGAEFRVNRASASVRLVPCFPGCLVVPQSQDVDVRGEAVEARFFVTPLALGRLQDACVEIWQDGRRLDRVATPSRVTRQLVTRISAVMSILVGMTMALARFEDSSFAEPFFENLPALHTLSDQLGYWGQAVGGLSNLGLLVTGVLSLVTGCFWFDRRHAPAAPVEAALEGIPD